MLSYRVIIFCSVLRLDDGALHPAITVWRRDDVAVWACQVCARGHEIGVSLADIGLPVEEEVQVVAGQPLVKRRCQTLTRHDRSNEVRRHNDDQPKDRAVGFFGLDVYSLWESLYAILGYLQRVDPSALPAAWQALRCFEPYGEDVQEYARATRFVP